jgi:nucleotide-binding universal stress UspA family protein
MKILVALDGGETSSHVLPAVGRASELIPDAEVHLLTVVSPSRIRGRYSATDVTSVVGTSTDNFSVAPPPPTLVENHTAAQERIATEVRESLEELGKQHFPDALAAVHVEWSDKPADALVEFGEAAEVDLIAMATHGRTGFAHAFTHSVADEVIHKATCPVLVVGPSAAD